LNWVSCTAPRSPAIRSLAQRTTDANKSQSPHWNLTNKMLKKKSRRLFFWSLLSDQNILWVSRVSRWAFRQGFWYFDQKRTQSVLLLS